MNKIYELAYTMRAIADKYLNLVSTNTREINALAPAIRKWHPNAYTQNDVCIYNGIPYRCVQTHDSTLNPSWTPDITPALWSQYHGTTPETARPFIHPTGAHDMYLKDEYAIYNGITYKAVIDTIYSPSEYAQAWASIN